MNRALKVRLYPTQEQEKFINKNLGCSRFLYNQMLNERIETYNKLKDNKEELYTHKYKTQKQYKEEFEFLKEADSHSLCWTEVNLKNAYANFYRSLKGSKTVGFPKFKSKHSNKDFYKSSSIIKIDFNKQRIQMMKMPGKTIKYMLHSEVKKWYIDANLKNITVSKTPSGKYYASCLFEKEETIKEKSKIVKVKGLDMSMQNFYVDEQGNSPEFNRNYRENEKKLAKYQRRLSSKTKGSHNREKARIKVAKVHERIANKRRDFTNKLSWKLIQENDCVVVENLNLKGMSQSLNLGKSVMDLGYSAFVSKLMYKAEWYGKTVVLADRWFASSKTCHVCGYIKKDLMLQERTWKCPLCDTTHHRDQNAAINLVNLINTESNPGI